MAYNQVVRFALSDANGVGMTDTYVDAKIEAGAVGIAVRGGSNIGGICVDYSGNIYIADSAEHCIIKIDEGGRVSNFAGTPGSAGSNKALMNVPCNSAEFNTPMGLCCDKSNNIYVADAGNNQIRVINSGRVSLVAGTGGGSTGFTDGVGGEASFNMPVDVCVDNSGNLYVADYGNNAIRKIVHGGRVYKYVGGPTAGDKENVTGIQDGVLNGPKAVSVDAAGNLYVCDTGNLKIKKVTPDGWVYLHSGSGSEGHVLGTPYTSTYEGPVQSGCDRSGNLYVVDNDQEGYTRLLKLDFDGKPSVVANFTSSSYNNGTIGVAVSPAQKLFVAMSDPINPIFDESSSSSSSSEGYTSSSSSSSEGYTSSSSSSSSS